MAFIFRINKFKRNRKFYVPNINAAARNGTEDSSDGADENYENQILRSVRGNKLIENITRINIEKFEEVSANLKRKI